MADGDLIGGTQWCAECRGFKVIEDHSTETTIEGGYMRRSTTEVSHTVLRLACGHQWSARSGEATYRDTP